MTPLDWMVIVLYLAGMIALSVYLARGQTSEADYYVGGRNLPWWAVGISTMATQSSAISFISIPAFVAGKAGPASEEELGRGPFRATIPITSLTERKNNR